MTAAVPTRTDQQRMAGLARANAIRFYRAEVKRNLKGGADPISILTAPPPELLTMSVRTFLLAIPKIGPEKSRRILIAHSIAQSKTLGGLSDRQRRELVKALSR